MGMRGEKIGPYGRSQAAGPQTLGGQGFARRKTLYIVVGETRPTNGCSLVPLCIIGAHAGGGNNAMRHKCPGAAPWVEVYSAREKPCRIDRQGVRFFEGAAFGHEGVAMRRNSFKA
jgi:hypothetical protein